MSFYYLLELPILSAGVDYSDVNTTVYIVPATNQKTQTCAVVSPRDDMDLEGNEDFSVNLSNLGEGNNITIIQGAETLNVQIQDDEGC